MSDERWRCFVAVLLGDNLRSRLGSAMAAWRADPRTHELRWVEPGNLHVTLAFLGSIEPDRVAGVERKIQGAAARHEPMTRPTGRLGAFSRPGSARVLWYAVGDTDGALASLTGDLADALEQPRDGEHRPHITLARARRRSVDLRGWIEAASAAAPSGSLEVREVHLMRSRLGGGPARYETLATIPLGVHSRV
ncbi:MAG: RNA 2',3'-cyclic phosphodiesterase [Candidatus Limnocylindria bacterium]